MGTETLTLPTRGGEPVASPELVRDEIGEVAGDLRAGRWQVPTLELELDLAPWPYCAAWTGETAASGASVMHLIELAEFAAELVARGRVLPVVLSDPPRAVWHPVLTGPDAAWTRILASSMPPPLIAAASRRRASRLVRCPGRPGGRGRASSSRLDPAHNRKGGNARSPRVAGRTDGKRTPLHGRPTYARDAWLDGRCLAAGRRGRPGTRLLPAEGAGRRRRLASAVWVAGRGRAESVF